MTWVCGKRAAAAFVGFMLVGGAVQAGEASAAAPKGACAEVRQDGACPMSDEELAQVWGFGLGAPTLQALTRQDQSASFASADGALTALSTLTAEGTATLERQAARQQAQAATVGLQHTLQLAQTMAAATQLVAPVLTGVMPVPPFPGFTLPVPPALGQDDHKKH